MIAVIPNASHVKTVADLLGDCIDVWFFESMDELKDELKKGFIDVDSTTRVVDGGKVFSVDYDVEEVIHVEFKPL